MPGRRRNLPADVRLETQRALTARGMRTPRFDYQSTSGTVGDLVPMLFAPVLAGDTIKSANLMARVFLNPYDKLPRTRGVWYETWMFYVRIGDMPAADQLREVLVDPTRPGNPDWRYECMSAIWKGYFVDERAPTGWNQGGYNWLRIPGSGWWDSATEEADLPAPTPGADQWETQWQRFEVMRRSKLTTKTFEEYLAAQGVAVPPQLRQEHDPELKVPELLHYSREFVYPQPAGFGSGDPPVEVQRYQWFINERMERGRFCAEPGFVVLCGAVRPKVYRVTDFDPLDLLDSAEGWLPIDLDTDPHTSLVEIDANAFEDGSKTPGANAVIDVRDLFLHGYQVGDVDDLFSPFLRLDQTFSFLQSEGTVPTFEIDATWSLNIASRISKDTTA